MCRCSFRGEKVELPSSGIASQLLSSGKVCTEKLSSMAIVVVQSYGVSDAFDLRGPLSRKKMVHGQRITNNIRSSLMSYMGHSVPYKGQFLCVSSCMSLIKFLIPFFAYFCPIRNFNAP